jgi:hypothetical protein
MTNTIDRTQRARTLADRWTDHVAAHVTTPEQLQIFAEQRAARAVETKQAAALLYRDGSATLLAFGAVAAINPAFGDEAELIQQQRDPQASWILDLFSVLRGEEPEYRGEAKTAYQSYVDELRTLALEFGAAVGAPGGEVNLNQSPPQSEPPPPAPQEQQEAQARLEENPDSLPPQVQPEPQHETPKAEPKKKR